MNKQKIFVFPCGSEIGLEIYRSLCFAKEVELYGGSSVHDHGQFVYEKLYNLPFITESNFLPYLNKVITKLQINYILPTHDSVVLKLAEYQSRRELSCPVITSPLVTCEIARSKKRTMEFFSKIIRTPRLYENIKEVHNYPVFLKPDVGQGSKRTVLANDKEEALFFLSRNPDLLIFEYLPGQEYTVDCYTNSSGALLFSGGRERCRISNGISVNTKPVNNIEIQNIAEKINESLDFRGMWFFQLKRAKNGDLALMEIAPRLAGTMGMYRNLGVNFALMNIYEAQGYQVSSMPNSFDIEVDRALCSKFKTNIDYKHIYVDLDDCLLIEGKVNCLIMLFLYQCINDGIRIHLLTRHTGDINRTLTEFRLNGLFDSISCVKNKEKKSSYIKYGKSIFIDDSFSERKEVLMKKNIPVFAPDAVESLIK